MRISTIMTTHPACCRPDETVADAAKRMLTHDCGSLPVVEAETQRLVGVVTDRDIAMRAVAAGRDPNATLVQDVMSHPVAVVSCEATLQECVRLMEENQVRRAPVIDQNGKLVGIVSQADVVRATPESLAGELVKEISKGPSRGHLL